MKHIRGLVSTAQALRHTFLHPLEISRVPFTTRYGYLQPQRQLRFIQYSRASKSPAANASPKAQGIIKDEDIRAPQIQVVNDNGALDPPERTIDVLRSINRSEYFLVQVSPGAADRLPVCKLVSKKGLREQEKAKAKAAHSAKTAVKQIELNWAIDAHDLSHRMKQLVSFIEKGRKVEIILTRKRGKRAPTAEEVKKVMDAVLDTVQNADAAQVKPMEGEPGKHVLIVVKKKDA
ncbi:translation initiation factor IF3, putative [Paecilomyces variotii No. 5]|uniref:Translation initiation factor IF3, putative n=1 Tax=Byssochlamys spectabilis (strain No. 5 / NBRC 109023) TaxID=1356009 RepID=V5FD30_BYSSN|nr:translation initiation factor IF3, putative [Paecilomyces variotii No. 5]